MFVSLRFGALRCVPFCFVLVCVVSFRPVSFGLVCSGWLEAGGVLVCFLAITIIFLIKHQEKSEEDIDLEVTSFASLPKSLILLFFGGVFLYLGSEWFISGAISLASSFGISERIIGITIVSVGTSIPELVTSMVAVFNKEKSIS